MHRSYLVESSSGEILLILRYFGFHVADDDVVLSCKEDPNCEFPYKTLRFDVFKLDPRQNKFKLVKNLGEEALFLGMNNSFSLPATDQFPGIKANSVYFGDHSDIACHHPLSVYGKNYTFGGHDFGIFSLEDNSFSPFYDTRTKKFSAPPIWLQPNQLVRNPIN
ncbi:hypothetical protein ACH5RR_012194 [Cinchona calisaya]|uniref:KIB1-4 beta-propeller domain-containing protein n=1 Tax=Cinchona calisaya TaxID=153742 RepID=A0ABD3ACX9_9GENT